MTVRKFLDLSTAHLPARFYQDGCDLTGRYPLDAGMLLWVPDDPADPANHGTDEDADDGAPEVIALRVYARGLGCDYIMLDRDAEIDPALPTFGERADAPPEPRIVTLPVLAGAYRGKRRSLAVTLTHSIDAEDAGGTAPALCGQGNIGDIYGTSEEDQALAPTCAKCFRKDPRFKGDRVTMKGAPTDAG